MREALGKFYIENVEIKPLKEFHDSCGDGEIYEVIKVIKGRPLFYEEHYKRMKNSFALKKITIEYSEDQILELIFKLIKENDKLNGNIKITYNIKLKLLRIFFIVHTYPTNEMYKNGVDAIIYYGERSNPQAKIVNSELRCNINLELNRRNAYEAVLVGDNEIITEGSKSNIFFIKDEIIQTPKSENVLPGVTRTEIIKEAKKVGIRIEEKNIYLNKINEYDSAFISGTSPNILPIKKIDEIKYDVNNEVLRKIMLHFERHIEKYIK